MNTNKKANYWISTAFKNAFLLIIMCTVYAAIMSIGNDEKSIIKILNETIMFYYMIVSVAIGAVFCNTTIPIMLDIVLSLGSTRKDAFKHINIFVSIFTILLTITFTILGLVTGKSISKLIPAIITYTSCILFSSGIGAFGGAHNLKKGSKLLLIYFISMLLSILLSIGLLLFSGTVNIMTDGDFSFDFARFGTVITIVSVILACIFYPLGMTKMKKQLYLHEVRI